MGFNLGVSQAEVVNAVTSLGREQEDDVCPPLSPLTLSTPQEDIRPVVCRQLSRQSDGVLCFFLV